MGPARVSGRGQDMVSERERERKASQCATLRAAIPPTFKAPHARGAASKLLLRFMPGAQLGVPLGFPHIDHEPVVRVRLYEEVARYDG